MFSLMLLFVLLAIAAGYFGFFALAGTAAILFFVAILAIIIRGVDEAARGRPPV